MTTDPRLHPRPCAGRDCAATIAFTVTQAGRLLPIDLEPTPDGNVELTDRTELVHALEVPVVIVHGNPTLDAGPRYLPHFATCPNADDFRRRT